MVKLVGGALRTIAKSEGTRQKLRLPEENDPQMTQMDTERENSRGINRRGRRGPQRKSRRNEISILLCGLCGQSFPIRFLFLSVSICVICG
jgi:hypothetical protein